MVYRLAGVHRWISHDFTEMRRLALHEHSSQHNEHHHVDAAIEVLSMLLVAIIHRSYL